MESSSAGLRKVIFRLAVPITTSLILGIGGKSLLSSPSIAAAALPDVTGPVGLRPRTIELAFERAARARAAIFGRDYDTASHIIRDELAHSKMQSWRFYPFHIFINSISDVGDPAYGDRLDAWIARNDADMLPLRLRAQYEYDMAWAVRGGNFLRQTNRDDIKSFASYSRQAISDIDAVLARDASSPYDYALKLRILHGYGNSPQFTAAFDDAIKHYPGYYALYSTALATLQPKWGGSTEKMVSFVNTYAAKAPISAPLQMLYLELYVDLAIHASDNCTNTVLNDDGIRQCVAKIMQAVITPDIEAGVTRALNLVKSSDRSQYDQELGQHLKKLIGVAGAGAYAGAVLQLAANATDSDTRISEEKKSHPNDYMIDSVVGVSWSLKRNFPYALQKDQEVLQDLSAMVFADEETKDIAYADAFENLAVDYDDLQQYDKVIAYERAAVAYGGPHGFEHLICHGYIQLRQFQQAVDACSPLINHPDGMASRYWRAVAYEELHQSAAAAADWKVIADSEDDRYRSSALIRLSLYYGNRHDYQGIIDIFAAHPFAFDEVSQTKTDLAIAYNNRCYAYMQLGQLRRALDDCTSSLRYDNIPDAFSKQQELVARLGARAK